MKRMNLIELDNEENMKSFFKACLYEELDDYENADSMRNLFINIIYNGFDVNKYLDWILDISDDTKIAITKGVKEKKNESRFRKFTFQYGEQRYRRQKYRIRRLKFYI